jgi:hypothetical protein
MLFKSWFTHTLVRGAFCFVVAFMCLTDIYYGYRWPIKYIYCHLICCFSLLTLFHGVSYALEQCNENVSPIFPVKYHE